MLRAKQLSALSQAARTFYLSGPRCGSLDGASCTCSEDENQVSKNQSNHITNNQKTNVALLSKGKGNVTPIASQEHGSQCQQNVVRSSNQNSSYPEHESRCLPYVVGSSSHQNSSYADIAQNVLPLTSSRSNSIPLSRKTNCVNDGECTAGNDFVQPHKLPVGHSKASKYGILSDAVFNNFQTTESEARKCVVDSSQLFPGDNIAIEKRCNTTNYSEPQSNSSVHFLERSNLTPISPGYSREKNSNDGYGKAMHNVSGASFIIQRTRSDVEMQRQSASQKAKFRNDRFISDGNTEGRVFKMNVTGTIAESAGSAGKFHKPGRTAKLHINRASPSSRSVNSRDVIEQYNYTLRSLKWGQTMEDALDYLHCKLKPFEANQVLKVLHDHTVALEFFSWLKFQPGFKHDGHTYTTMIGILGQAKQFDTMRRLLENMTKDGCQPTVVTYNRMIHAYGRANFLSEAISLLQEMQEAGCCPDRVTYCTLIDIHAKAGYLELAMDIYRQMHEVGLSPDTFTYSAMVNCLGKAGHLAAAYKLFREMIEHGCVPNLVTYNIMIALQAKARNYPTVMKLYEDMQAAGFCPDKITYSTVMEVLGHCGYLNEAEAVFEKMTRNWVPDEPVYGLLVDLWGKAGNVDRAQAWYYSMLNAGLQPNVPTCNSLLSAFLKGQWFADAHDMLVGMLKFGLVPSLQTYTLLLSCCTVTQLEMGLCSRLMSLTGHPAHAFMLSLPDAEPNGENVRLHANAFFDLVHSEDRESKRGLVDAVIEFLHKWGHKEEAGWVWEVAAERNIYPDSVKEKCASYWLVNLHFMSEGTALTALSRTLAWFQRQVLSSGIRPSRIDIITGWGRRSRAMGSSLVRQSIQELLVLSQFPFFTENGNSGCFVGCGESLNRWLLNSYVERMHLL